jgi:hypothetical protein
MSNKVLNLISRKEASVSAVFAKNFDTKRQWLCHVWRWIGKASVWWSVGVHWLGEVKTFVEKCETFLKIQRNQQSKRSKTRKKRWKKEKEVGYLWKFLENFQRWSRPFQPIGARDASTPRLPPHLFFYLNQSLNHFASDVSLSCSRLQS